MKYLILLISAFGLLVGMGGLIGFFIAGSIASLIAGSTFSFLLLLSGYLMQSHPTVGLIGATFLTMTLSGFFSYRYLITEKFMPSGMMALLSLAIFFTLIVNVSLKRKVKSHRPS